jgi:hypothetical protein
MQVIADILMTAGAFGAAIYCYVLSNRLKKFTTLESGMGSAIAVLSVQVDDMTRALEGARGAAHAQADGTVVPVVVIVRALRGARCGTQSEGGDQKACAQEEEEARAHD